MSSARQGSFGDFALEAPDAPQPVRWRVPPHAVLRNMHTEAEADFVAALAHGDGYAAVQLRNRLFFIDYLLSR